MGSANPRLSTPRTVLVCEDDGLIRMNTLEMLEELGYAAIAAKDASAAIAALQESQVDILLTDVSLPDMSGIVLAQRLQLQYPELPVIFATGYGHIGITPGPNVSLLTKPFTVDSLANALLAVTTVREQTKLADTR